MIDRPIDFVVAEFLRDALAGGALAVPELEGMVRAAGLLGEHQRITHAKAFKRGKKSLGIQSVRDGFGAGRWLWRLPTVRPTAGAADHLSAVSAPVGDIYADVQKDAFVEDLRETPAHRRIPSDWIIGIASLEHHRAPPDVPAHRWRQFLGDCNSFLRPAENWAECAAKLGWNAWVLCGCRRNRPLMHPGDAGLLWAINGGRLVPPSGSHDSAARGGRKVH
jgi:hypothetical protein